MKRLIDIVIILTALVVWMVMDALSKPEPEIESYER